MQINDEEKPYDDLNITPMLDLAYVLLVIFILLTTASVQGAKIDLPKSNLTTSLAAPKTKVISVKPDGQLAYNDSPVSFEELRTKLRDAVAADPKLPIIIKGDAASQYDKVYMAMELCGQLGINTVGLAAQHGPGS